MKPEMLTQTRFHRIGIGAVFHKGKHNAGPPRRGPAWCEWVKISKSRAKCLRQINFGNQRQVGHVNPVAPHAVVFPVMIVPIVKD